MDIATIVGFTTACILAVPVSVLVISGLRACYRPARVKQQSCVKRGYKKNV